MLLCEWRLGNIAESLYSSSWLVLFLLPRFIDDALSPSSSSLSAVMTEAKPSSARWAWGVSSWGWTAAFRGCASTSAERSPSPPTWPTEASGQVCIYTTSRSFVITSNQKLLVQQKVPDSCLSQWASANCADRKDSLRPPLKGRVCVCLSD